MEKINKEPFALGNENIKEAIARIPTHPEHGIEWLHPIPPRGTLLYTHPAPSWQGISEAEAGAIFRKSMTPHEFARAIEQAHGIGVKDE